MYLISIKVNIFTLYFTNLFLERGYLVLLPWRRKRERKKNCVTDVEKEFVLVIENHSNVRNHPQKDSKSPLTSQHMGDPEILKYLGEGWITSLSTVSLPGTQDKRLVLGTHLSSASIHWPENNAFFLMWAASFVSALADFILISGEANWKDNLFHLLSFIWT